MTDAVEARINGAGSTALPKIGNAESPAEAAFSSLCAVPIAISMKADAGTRAWPWTCTGILYSNMIYRCETIEPLLSLKALY